MAPNQYLAQVTCLLMGDPVLIIGSFLWNRSRADLRTRAGAPHFACCYLSKSRYDFQILGFEKRLCSLEESFCSFRGEDDKLESIGNFLKTILHCDACHKRCLHKVCEKTSRCNAMLWVTDIRKLLSRNAGARSSSAFSDKLLAIIYKDRQRILLIDPPLPR